MLGLWVYARELVIEVLYKWARVSDAEKIVIMLWPLPLHGFARWLLIEVDVFFCANNTPKSMKCSKAKVTSRHIVVAQRHLGLVSCLACFQVWGLFRSSFFCFIVACCAISSISASSVIRLIFSSCLRRRSTSANKKFLQIDFLCHYTQQRLGLFGYFLAFSWTSYTSKKVHFSKVSRANVTDRKLVGKIE